jgi:hypothetical protein
MLNILFIKRDDITKRTPYGGNIDPDKLVPFIKTSQDKYILPVLGTVLFNKLQTIIADGTVGNVANASYKLLLDNYITDCLVYYAVVESLPFLSYNISNTGVQRHLSEQSVLPTKNEVDYLVEKALQSAQFYQERLLTYLLSESPQLYPEYYQSNGKIDNVYPNQGWSYTAGIHV